MNEIPLIYTIKGNLPQAELTYKTEWDIADTYIKFTERHYDSSGELVRESCHVYDKLGLSGEVATSL